MKKGPVITPVVGFQNAPRIVGSVISLRITIQIIDSVGGVVGVSSVQEYAQNFFFKNYITNLVIVAAIIVMI